MLLHVFVASIISKKAAEQLDSLILDVKIGNGSTTGSEQDSRELADRMVHLFLTKRLDCFLILYFLPFFYTLENNSSKIMCKRCSDLFLLFIAK